MPWQITLFFSFSIFFKWVLWKCFESTSLFNILPSFAMEKLLFVTLRSGHNVASTWLATLYPALLEWYEDWMRPGKSAVWHSVGEIITRIFAFSSPWICCSFSTPPQGGPDPVIRHLNSFEIINSDIQTVFICCCNRLWPLCLPLASASPASTLNPQNDMYFPLHPLGTSFPKFSPCCTPTQHCSVFSVFGCQLLFIYYGFTYLCMYKVVVLFSEDSKCKSLCKSLWKVLKKKVSRIPLT